MAGLHWWSDRCLWYWCYSTVDGHHTCAIELLVELAIQGTCHLPSSIIPSIIVPPIIDIAIPVCSTVVDMSTVINVASVATIINISPSINMSASVDVVCDVPSGSQQYVQRIPKQYKKSVGVVVSIHLCNRAETKGCTMNLALLMACWRRVVLKIDYQSMAENLCLTNSVTVMNFSDGVATSVVRAVRPLQVTVKLMSIGCTKKTDICGVNTTSIEKRPVIKLEPSSSSSSPGSS